MAKKRIRKNYYKNSGAQKRARVLGRCLFGLKITSLVVGLGAMSLLSIFVYDALTQSPHFAAQRITIKGNERISREAILKQAGVKLEENILSLNVSALCSKILVHPWVADVDVERELPDAIHIQIKEHVPIAIIDLGKFFYVGDDGKIFNGVISSDREAMPLVTGLERDLDLKDPWRSRLFASVMEALRLSRLHKEAKTFGALHRVHVDKKIGVTLYASFPQRDPAGQADFVSIFGEEPARSSRNEPNPVTIKIGFGDYASKYDRLQHIISHLSEDINPSDLECIDLHDADRVVVRPSRSEKRSVARSGDGWKRGGKEV